MTSTYYLLPLVEGTLKDRLTKQQAWVDKHKFVLVPMRLIQQILERPFQ